jgi:maltose alpha-D-glucosyltransferase/alpha-amylase
LQLLHPSNQRVLAYLRRYGNQELLIVNNLSRFSQPVELDLRECAGRAPIELFGETRFPTIGQAPYFLTLGPHGFYWFRLEAIDP